ncbi:phenol 2-monooxygenase [Rhodococcus opacus]|uniref:phenol 2-monooxygenase n=1 Tax=Rhodococcus opacus TaxID=37919 RepID=UPI0009C02927|nr:phenol 2-monooxygenase [Rhodococcus opacus]CAG7632038.1 hypothetical protein E143388_07360 [Rhodococcus opacus]
MQYELRQQVIEPRRHTFQALIERNGDRPATRYEEGTIGVQPRENFHYRPFWDPEHELYDEGYTALRLSAPDTFIDPRQYYYAPYVSARAQLHDSFGKTLDYVEQRNLLERLPQAWRAVLGSIIVPLRHYESGAQLVLVEGARFAYGATVSQCLSYASFDRIGLAQMLSRIGMALGDRTDDVLVEAKLMWLESPALQGLRRYVEELLVERDWAKSMFALDLLDRLIYPVLYRYLDEAAVLEAGAYSLLAQHPSDWFADHRRWLDALLAAWVDDSEHHLANKMALEAVVTTKLPQAIIAATQIADAIDAALGTRAGAVISEQAVRLEAELAAGDDRGQFPHRVRGTRGHPRGGEVDMAVDQLRQAGLFGEFEDRDQPGRRHEIVFVEHRGPSRERVR